MGRIHRYGQRKDCLIFNFVASNTIEGHVLQRLLRDEQDKDKNWHVVERSYGSFSRAIPLPFDPDPAKVEAKFDNGVLRIHLPKPLEVASKQQKIEIKKG
jgi:HSP20 family molecular chaperone IbpA